jgi:phage-related protein
VISQPLDGKHKFVIWLLLEFALVLTEFRKNYGCDELDIRLEQLLELGNRCRPPITKFVQDGIFELRAKSKRGHLRVLYFYGPDHLQITAVHAVLKKRPKLDPDDIKTARRRKKLIESQQVIPNVHHYDS